MGRNPRYAAHLRCPAFLHVLATPTLPKTGALRPEICDLWPIFQYSWLTGPKTRSIYVMFLSKNVMSFYLLDPMDGHHTWGKKTELYRNFTTVPPPHEELQKPKSRTMRCCVRATSGASTER